MGVDQLAGGNQAAELEQHALGLQPLADRRRVEPGQRAGAVALAGGPGGQPFRGAPALPVAVADLRSTRPRAGASAAPIRTAAR